MRIVHHLRRIDLAEGGVVRSVLDLCGALSEAGHEVILLTHDAGDAPAAWRAGGEGIPTVVVLPPAGRIPGRVPSGTRRAMRAAIEPADVLHLHTPWEPVNPAAARLARSAGTPYIVSIHGMLDDWSMAQRGLKKRAYLAVLGRRLLEGAAFVHCTASAERDQASRWFPRGRSRVLPCLVDVEPYRAPVGAAAAANAWPELAGDEPVILFLSRLHYKKGAEVLIDAAGRLHADGRRFRLVLAGPGDEAYVRGLRERARGAGVESITTFTGHVAGETKRALYERATIFALPTSQENFGIVFPEALASGTPVITTRGVDIWPELEASGGARIVDRDAGAFAGSIAAMLADPDETRSMGERGRTWALATFSGAALLEGYVAMYRAAVDPAQRIST